MNYSMSLPFSSQEMMLYAFKPRLNPTLLPLSTLWHVYKSCIIQQVFLNIFRINPFTASYKLTSHEWGRLQMSMLLPGLFFLRPGLCVTLHNTGCRTDAECTSRQRFYISCMRSKPFTDQIYGLFILAG